MERAGQAAQTLAQAAQLPALMASIQFLAQLLLLAVGHQEPILETVWTGAQEAAALETAASAGRERQAKATPGEPEAVLEAPTIKVQVLAAGVLAAQAETAAEALRAAAGMESPLQLLALQSPVLAVAVAVLIKAALHRAALVEAVEEATVLPLRLRGQLIPGQAEAQEATNIWAAEAGLTGVLELFS